MIMGDDFHANIDSSLHHTFQVKTSAERADADTYRRLIERWSYLRHDLVHGDLHADNIRLIQAPMGSGKTTALLHSLLDLAAGRCGSSEKLRNIDARLADIGLVTANTDRWPEAGPVISGTASALQRVDNTTTSVSASATIRARDSVWHLILPACLASDSRDALLRFVDGVLAALRLMLVVMLAALSRVADVVTFVLVMLAACLRYGRRQEPGDHDSLVSRRYQTSAGRVSTSW